jgi:hypothetical protein
LGEKDWESVGWRMFDRWRRRTRRVALGLGVFLIVVGVCWFARDLGLIPLISVWSVVAIGFGVWIIFATLQ